jgi:hypothetical protein
MLSFRKAMLALAAVAGMAAGQPALTTIQDTLYTADGNRFNGTMFITYSSFQSGDNNNIATANLTLTIVNGVLNVQLVPTTTASAGAQYNVTFNSAGVNQFTEVWSVPPSSVPLRVAAVLVSQGTVVGPAPVTTAITIADVTGLENELALLVQQGVGFAVNRAAVIDGSGQLDGASGNLSDCLRVDGSSGPCGSGGGGVLPSFSTGEMPGGTANGSNTTFTLANVPSPASSLQLYVNGLLMTQALDYTLSGNTISFLTASTPQTGDLLSASYRYANPSNPLGTLTAAQVICSQSGASTSATTLTQLGSCTIPAGLLGTGDRIEIQFQFGHTGTSTAFTGAILWAGAGVFSRTTVAAETAVAGRMTFGIGASAQTWAAQSWGNSLSFQAGVGSASANIAQNLTVSFEAGMVSSTTDTVNLSNFTVMRYPAQSNP